MFHPPQPQSFGYVFLITVTACLCVLYGMLPAYLDTGWIDHVGHFSGGLAVGLCLRLIADWKGSVVVGLMIAATWESFEWFVGYPFYVTATDTLIDVGSYTLGLVVVLVVTSQVGGDIPSSRRQTRTDRTKKD